MREDIHLSYTYLILTSAEPSAISRYEQGNQDMFCRERVSTSLKEKVDGGGWFFYRKRGRGKICSFCECL